LEFERRAVRSKEFVWASSTVDCGKIIGAMARTGNTRMIFQLAGRSDNCPQPNTSHADVAKEGENCDRDLVRE
jgi:hypothetical protein